MSCTQLLKRKRMGCDPVVVTRTISGMGEIRGLCTRADGSFLATTSDNKIWRATSEFRESIFAKSKIAGDDHVVCGHDDGDAQVATFDSPTGIITDRDGNCFVADMRNHCIRKLNRASGAVTTWVGIGQQGHNDGASDTATFSQPRALALLPDGAIAVADTANNCIRVVSTEGVVRTLCGGDAGNVNGDGATARFHTPFDLVVDRDGNLLASLRTRVRTLGCI
jgi:DNA-binding beta-propeller fold protein YncE